MSKILQVGLAIAMCSMPIAFGSLLASNLSISQPEIMG